MTLIYLPLNVHGGCEGCAMRPHCEAIVNTDEPLACELPDEQIHIDPAPPTRSAYEWIEPVASVLPYDWWREAI